MGAFEIFVLNNPFWAYLILFGGMFIEGEAFFLTATIFAFHGLLSWPLILLTTFVGVILGDIAWYGLGKYLQGTKLGFLLKIKFSTYHAWLDQNFISRYPRMAIYSKFLYYINRLTPLIAGWQGLGFRNFLRVHFNAAVIWIGIIAIVNYFLVSLVGSAGVRWLLDRIGLVFLVSAALFIAVEYCLKRIFSKKISRTL